MNIRAGFASIRAIHVAIRFAVALMVGVVLLLCLPDKGAQWIGSVVAFAFLLSLFIDVVRSALKH